MPHQPGHVFDPYNLSPEEEKSRRLLRQAEDALAPAAMRGQLGERGPLQEFLIEQADEIKNITGAKRARITDPDAFGAFLEGRSAEFEEFTGRPSPMRQAMLAEEGALSPTGMPERPGERGLSKMEKVELAAFAASPLLMGMAPYFASEIGAELLGEGVERLPSWVPTPVTTGLEGLLAAAALKRGKITPKTAALGFSVGAGIGDVADKLGFGEQAEQLGAMLSGGISGDAVTGFGFRGPTLFAGAGRTADPTGVRLPSGRVGDPSATVAAIRNLPQRGEQFAADVGQTGVGNVLQPPPRVQQAARAADDVTGRVVGREDSVPGGTFKHFTSQESQEALQGGQPFDPLRNPQHGMSDLGRGGGNAKMAGDRLYLSLDDKAWSSTIKSKAGGRVVENTPENRELGQPFYDYDSQSWKIEIDGAERVNLHPVEFEISPNARILRIDSESAHRRARQLVNGGFLIDNSRGAWDQLAQNYDVVEIRNVRRIRETDPDNNFFKTVGDDQLVVLNPEVARVKTTTARPATPAAPDVTGGGREAIRARIGTSIQSDTPSTEFSFHISNDVEGIANEGLQVGGLSTLPIDDAGLGDVVHVFRNADLPAEAREQLARVGRIDTSYARLGQPRPIATFTRQELGLRPAREIGPQEGFRAQELGFETEPPIERLVGSEELARIRAQETAGEQALRTRVAAVTPATPPVRAAEDVAGGTKRINEIRAEIDGILRNSPGGSRLTGRDATRYQQLVQEAESIRFDQRQNQPLKINDIKSASARRSVLSADEVLITAKALGSDKNVYMAIAEAAAGTKNASPTILDDIVNGTNQTVSLEKLYETFAPVRNSLKQTHGDTIHLFRATGEQIEKPTTNWASTREGALQYGTNVIEQDVPIDDILAVNVGLSGNYEEFIVTTIRPARVAQAPTPPIRPATPDVPPVRPVQGGFEGIAGDVARPTAEQPGMAQASFIGETATEDAAIAAELARRGGQVVGDVPPTRQIDAFQKQLDDAQADIDYAKSVNDYEELARAEAEYDVLARAGDDLEAQAIIRKEDEIARLQDELKAATESGLDIPVSIRQGYFAGWSDNKIIAFAQSEQRDPFLGTEWWDTLDPVALSDFTAHPNFQFGSSGIGRSQLRGQLAEARAELRELKGLPARKRLNQAPLTPGEPVTIIRSTLKTKTGRDRKGGSILLQKADGSKRRLTQDEYDRFNAGEAVDDAATPATQPVRAGDEVVEEAVDLSEQLALDGSLRSTSNPVGQWPPVGSPQQLIQDQPSGMVPRYWYHYRVTGDKAIGGGIDAIPARGVTRPAVSGTSFKENPNYLEDSYIWLSPQPSPTQPDSLIVDISKLSNDNLREADGSFIHRGNIPRTALVDRPATPPVRAALKPAAPGEADWLGPAVADQAGLDRMKAAKRSPVARRELINEAQEANRQNPGSVPEEVSEYASREIAAPDGGPPPPPPPKRGSKQPPEADPSEILKRARKSRLEEERFDQRLLIQHEAAIANAERQARIVVNEGNDELLAAKLGGKSRGTVVPRNQTDIDRFDNLLEALNEPSRVRSGELTVEPALRKIYDDLRADTDFEQAARIDFDPEMATVDDYFYRGWKPPEMVVNAKKDATGKLVTPPDFTLPRVDASYREMRNAGFEPLFWNPYEQARLARMQGIKYRQQMELVEALKELDDDIIRPKLDSTNETGFRVPEIGPAFEGKSFELKARRWIVRNDVANLLETMYGKKPSLGTLSWKVGTRTRNKAFETDILKVIDWLVFIPKRIGLFGTFFQQLDFLTRAGFGSFGNAVDLLARGKPIKAAQAIIKYPQIAAEILAANVSATRRRTIMEAFDSTKPLIEGRNVSLKSISDEGLSVRDVTIFPEDMDVILREAAQDRSIVDPRRAGRAIAGVERAMRAGLFQGVYPAAVKLDVENNIAPQMARLYGDELTDAQLSARIAKAANIKYSTIPASQSALQNRFIRETAKRGLFSVAELEGLLRQATNTIKGPGRKYWAANWLGGYIFLMVVANIIHTASTGKILPLERYSPVSKGGYGPLPIGYNTRFAAPTVPGIARGGLSATLDIVGQMDTAFRVLDPKGFVGSRFSIPIRAAVNQWSGEDFYERPINDVGPGGVVSRTTALLLDMFSPFGAGPAAEEVARKFVPGADVVIPRGESRLGLTGLGIQALGINLRSMNNSELEGALSDTELTAEERRTISEELARRSEESGSTRRPGDFELEALLRGRGQTVR